LKISNEDENDSWLEIWPQYRHTRKKVLSG
jgi:hypothetical protein